MPRPIRDQILPYLKKNLPPQRLGHVMGVAALARKIAGRHGLNAGSAELAGLLHDAAKYWKPENLIQYVKKYRLKVPDMKITLQTPEVLHGYVSAHLAKMLFGVKHPEILSAIARHTLGSEKMGPLDRCVYIADFAAPDRKYSQADRLRRLAMKDLNRAFVEGVRIKVTYMMQCGRRIHPETLRMWNRLMEAA